MDKITVLIVLSILAMAVENGQNQSPGTKDYWDVEKAHYLSNPKLVERQTRNQVKTIFDTFQLFSLGSVEKSYAEWILQHEPFDTMPSELMNSKNITFTSFIKDDQIFKISSLHQVDCSFRKSFLEISFIARKTNRNVQLINGSIEFLRSGNFPSCRIPFDLNYINYGYDGYLVIRGLQDVTSKSRESFNENFEQDLKLFKMGKLEGESCQQNINEKQLQNDTITVINNIIEARLKTVVLSVFHSIIKKCLNTQFDENKQTYSYFRFSPNTSTFPWSSDYNELIVTGLDKFNHLKVQYSNLIVYDLRIHNINIRWYITSEGKKQFNYDVTSGRVKATFDYSMNYTKIDLKNIADTSGDNYNNIIEPSNDGYRVISNIGMGDSAYNRIEVNLPNIIEQRNDDGIDVDSEVRNKLTTLILAGIEQTFQKIRYDGATKFTNTISQILSPFNGKTFANLFDKFEKNLPKNSFVVFSKIEKEAYTHLENITCQMDEFNQKIGTISYKNIIANAEFSHSMKNIDGFKIRLRGSAYLHFKEVNIAITQQKHLKGTNEITAQISGDDFNKADTTISFDNHLPRKDRSSLGKLILEDFITLFRDRINSTVNSVFRSLWDTCGDSSRNITKSSSDDSKDWRNYFAFVRGHWINSTHPLTVKSVDVIINGIWNFKYISTRYKNENFAADNLRMENITGRMNLWNDQIKSSVIVNYTADYLIMTIDHANTHVRVVVPGGLKYVKGESNSLPPIAEVTEKFETTVGSFIEQSVYGGSNNYHAKYRTLVSEIMMEVVQKDTPLMYDLTTVFVDNFVNTLKSIPSKNIFFPSETITFNHINASLDLTKTPIEIAANFTFPTITEETCKNINYSQNVDNFTEEINIHTNITIKPAKIKEDIEFYSIPLSTTINRNVSISKNKFSNRAIIDIPKQNMKINDEIIRKHLEAYETDDLIPRFTQLASKFAHKNYFKLISPPNICRRRLGSAVPSKKHFYLITKTINDVSQQLLIYHIKLYGLYNLKSLRLAIYSGTNSDKAFEITATNLTAHIIWSYYLGNSFLRKPEQKKLKIDQIILDGRIDNDVNRLIFTNRSRLQLSHHDLASTKLKETLEFAIIDSIKKSVKKKYLDD